MKDESGKLKKCKEESNGEQLTIDAILP